MLKFASFLNCLLILSFSSIYLNGSAQVDSRSGQPQSGPAPLYPATLPCAGDTIFHEDFEGGFPGTWTVVDGDTLSPEPAMGLQKGWQSRMDWKDSTNTIAVSPSWYINAGQSDDWLISPQITLGNNTCLSWSAYSQDRYFPEDYEVRISTTTNDTAGFLAHPPLVTVEEEIHDLNNNVVNLSDYAGQNVFIAFRQISDDQFVLALDDILMTNTEAVDIGTYTILPIAADTADTVRVVGTIANYGSDTVNSMQIHWSVDGGPVMTETHDSIALAPNDLFAFAHDSLWITNLQDAFHSLCVWTSDPSGMADQKIANDTLCITITTGSPVGRNEVIEHEAFMQVYPNPVQDLLNVMIRDFPKNGKRILEIMGTDGRLFLSQEMPVSRNGDMSIGVENLPAGLYILRLKNENGEAVSRRFLKQ